MPPLKVYVSSHFNNKGQVKLLMNNLRSIGCEITYDWTSVPTVDKNPAEFYKNARNAVQGVKTADILVCVIKDPNEIHRGVFAEIGMAIGFGRRVLVFNEKQELSLTFMPSKRIETNIYYHYKDAVLTMQSWDEVIEYIQNEQVGDSSE